MSNLHRDQNEANKHTAKGFISGSNGSACIRNENGTQEFEKPYGFPSAINFVDGNAAPPTVALGDIYVLIDLGNGALHPDWTTIPTVAYGDWVKRSAVWLPRTPLHGTICFNKASSSNYYYDGSDWVSIGAVTTNIYNSNGTLTGTRAVTMAGFNLSFSGARTSFGANVYFGDGDAPLQVNATNTTSLLRGYTSSNVFGIALKAFTTTGGQLLIANASGTGVISLNGVGDSYFNAVGNFGIGLPTPSTKLHIISTVGVDALRIETSSGFLAKFTSANTFEIGGGGGGQRVYIKGSGATSGTSSHCASKSSLVGTSMLHTGLGVAAIG